MISTALQLILVLTPDWGSVDGQLLCFERKAQTEPFILRRDPIPCVVGEKGMAWGVGLHSLPKDALFSKKEGDRKAPAGIFRIGPIFIDSRYPQFLGEMPSVIVDQHWEGVDDPASAYYNQLIDVRTVAHKDWASSEKMQREEDDLYHFGMVIQNNSQGLPNLGSCIFMHRWRERGKGTFGCTAFDPRALQEVLQWLKPAAFPLIVQLPYPEYLQKREEWGLPTSPEG